MVTLTNPRADPPRHRAWWQGAVVHEIYPRSFADTDGEGVGNLRGVVAHLDYLAPGPDGLGVDTIWLTPFHPSGGVDGGYDVTDYRQVDPAYGTLEDFDHLVAQAHRRGLRLIVDWVPNHTSDRHPWFVEARASRDAPRRDWYVWADGRDGEPPNNWLSAFDDVGPAWSCDDATGQWYLHSFSVHQPDLNWDNPSLRAAMADVLRFWLRRGVDGFRIDVAHGLGKDPERADDPWPITKPTRESAGRRHDEDWHTVFEHLAELRHVADGFSDRLLVGEVYVLDQARLVEHAAPGRLAAVMLLTLRCTPFLFQGEELGLADSPIQAAAIVDGVAAQPQDPDSMLSLYRRLIALRKRHPALTRGGYRPESAPDDVFAHRRTDPDGDLLIALNFAAQERQLPDAFHGVPLLSSDPQRTEYTASSQLRLAPHEGLVLAAP